MGRAFITKTHLSIFLSPRNVNSTFQEVPWKSHIIRNTFQLYTDVFFRKKKHQQVMQLQYLPVFLWDLKKHKICQKSVQSMEFSPSMVFTLIHFQPSHTIPWDERHIYLLMNTIKNQRGIHVGKYMPFVPVPWIPVYGFFFGAKKNV